MVTNSPSIPPGYEQLVMQMSQATGLPTDVINAQVMTESGYNAKAVSPAGAEGWLQFLPSTYDTYAAQAGVASGSEFDPASEAKVYDVYMSSLLSQFSGNVQKALEAYNAGPGNLAAGASYADSILTQAGEPMTLQAGQGSQAQTMGAFGIPGLPTISISGILGNVFGDLRDIFERFGLILFGGVLILLGIHILSGGNAGSTTTNVYEAATPEAGTRSSGKTKTGSLAEAAGPAKGKHAAGAVGASETVEAAAAA